MGFFGKSKGHRRIAEQERADQSTPAPAEDLRSLSPPPINTQRNRRPSDPSALLRNGTRPYPPQVGAAPMHQWGPQPSGSSFGTLGMQYGEAQERIQDAALAAEEERQLAAAVAASLADAKPPDRTQEEKDRRLAIQLAEEEAARASRPECDEQLARRLQAQLDMEAGGPSFRLPIGGTHGVPTNIPRQGSGASSTPSTNPASPIGPVQGLNLLVQGSGCAKCTKPLGFGRYLSCLGKSYHPDCFTCKTCNKPIREQHFSVAGNEPYHSECHRRMFQPTCHVCKNYIPANDDGLIEYRAHPFWGEKYCPLHETDGTGRCCGCERLEPIGEQFIPHEDGRKLCLECCSSVVVDTNDCQPLYKEILSFYEQLGMPLRQAHIPMLLVERQALNEANQRERTGETPKKQGTHHHAETRGLCLSEEQVIQTVRRMNSGFETPGSVSRVETAPRVVRRHCEVTAILVLYGLPRLLTGSILAHELMHAWLRLHDSFPRLTPDKEEGICQAMAHLWLQNQMNRNGQPRRRRSSEGDRPTAQQDGPLNEVETRLAEFFLHQISHDSSPVYGGGFRAAHKAITQIGLSAVLEHLRLTANFP